MKSDLKTEIIKMAGIINEDTALAYVKGLYNSCFKDGAVLTTKTGNDFNENRLKINDKILNYANEDSFADEVANYFRMNYRQFFNPNQLRSFEGTIKNLAKEYYRKRKAQ